VPWGDWQFWMVTLAAALALALLVRMIRPAKRKPRRTQLTISAKNDPPASRR